jgi:hypothetical protein
MVFLGFGAILGLSKFLQADEDSVALFLSEPAPHGAGSL